MDILGEGIDAIDKASLFNEVTKNNNSDIRNIMIGMIEVGPYQPRDIPVTMESVEELADSIRSHGVLQPILIKELALNKYCVIAGERRLKASRYIGLTRIPCLVKNVSEEEAYAIAIIENIQRKQLNILEEASALMRLKLEYGFSNDDLAKSISKPRTTISNLIRLSEHLCDFGKSCLLDERIDYGHARTVLSFIAEVQEEALTDVMENKLSVRVLEQRMRNGFYPVYEQEEVDIKMIESVSDDLKNCISSMVHKNVEVKINKKGAYTVSINFKDNDEVASFLRGADIKEKKLVT